ncbi:MAG: insulinase family protein [Ignavibacteriales bacterium]|nr:insulinase family protein [Ignavibacteria bacterium]MBZ0197431.1 insulinase family protein [Ignavibacteriaceae bacterium]MCZ2144388.1 insulinase family protein [Ignavibacteriales bacterium]WKZ72952.1 MAG: pitrilysin family protein [Ignavibacteriaceae bacterium]
MTTNLFPVDKDRIVLLKTEEPVIHFKIWFNVGSKDDPKGKEGLAYLTAAMLNEGGTKNLTYSEIIDKLYPFAAGYRASVSKENTVYSGSVHKDNLNEYLEIFLDQLLNPGFREEDFNRLKQEAISFITTTLRYSSDEELGKAVLYNELYKNTPYGHLDAGSVSSLNSITLDDVKEFFITYYNRNNFILAIGGGYDDALIDKVWNTLEKLPDGKINPTKTVEPAAVSGLSVVIVEKKANATAISMGYPISILRSDPEWYPLALANSWLGEHRNSSSHLYQVIREARGLNYGDYSYIEYYPNGGWRSKPPVNVPLTKHLFEIWIRPVPNNAKHFALRAALREFTKLSVEGLKPDDFEITRKFLEKYVLHYAPDTDTRLGYALDDKFFGISAPGHLKKFRDKMGSVTLDEVNSAIKKYFNPENMVIVFITPDAEKLKNALVNNDASPIEYQTPKPNSVLEEDKEIINYKLKIKPENVKIVQVEELFN